MRAPAVDHTDETWSTVIQTNLTSGFVLARELGRQMVERGRGKIIFTASLLSFQGGINVASYAAAKSGLVGLVRALSNEWAPRRRQRQRDRTRVHRDRQHSCTSQRPRPEPRDPRAHPGGRWGEPSDLAGATVFLASAASDYVDGIVLPVDGGWLGR